MWPTKGINSMFSCTWVQFYKRGVGRWPRGWTPWPAYGWINVAPEPQVTIPPTAPSVFSKSGIRISSRQLLRRGSKRIYWTSKCFRHAIKHLGLCVKHTLTMRPRNFFSSRLLKPLHIILWPWTGNQCLLLDQNKIGEMGSDWNMFVIVVVH